MMMSLDWEVFCKLNRRELGQRRQAAERAEAVLAAISVIRQADLAVRAIVDPLRLEINQVMGQTLIHVRGKPDLAVLPGEVGLCRLGNGCWEAAKTVAGVKFFCLVRDAADEYWRLEEGCL